MRVELHKALFASLYIINTIGYYDNDETVGGYKR